VGDPPPSDESARESPVRWLDDSGSTTAARVQAKFARDRALLIGVFAPNCRRQKS
jgi:hypothetical protein